MHEFTTPVMKSNEIEIVPGITTSCEERYREEGVIPSEANGGVEESIRLALLAQDKPVGVSHDARRASVTINSKQKTKTASVS